MNHSQTPYIVLHMSRSRYGTGRHRQSWLTVLCPTCGLDVQARRTVPDKPLHVRAHHSGGTLCPCTKIDTVIAA